ncbi:protein kinase superfamily protein [Artemisia annua]|uniref:Protein kinase superfamily protein n=1 Tax=Artemisia annua TaxID=35608 RepID=A0A2U1P9N6_ARTAN|nr:protein kinase superfamily protein [Artemisia annua]
MPSRHLSFTHQQQQQHQHKTTLTFIFISITIFSSLLIILAISYIIYQFGYSLIQSLNKRLNKRIRTSPLDSHPHITNLRRFTYKELTSATNTFSRENHIGKGGSCTVYRGILKSGKLVAVKVMESDTSDSDREFSNELRILSSFDSRSQFVVSLLGYCIHKQRKLVVYEYMPNKSLQEALFGSSNNNNTTTNNNNNNNNDLVDTNKVLSWSRRFEIVRDVSYGLEFLHRECDPPVIHGDMKPSNVLLDTDFRAKISDFGLSKLKVEQDFGVDMFSQDLSGVGTGAGAVESPVIGTPVESYSNEVDFAVALQASSSSTPMNVKLGLGAINDKGKDVLIGANIENGNGNGNDWNTKKFTNFDANDEDLGHDFGKEQISCTDGLDDRTSKKQWGKDWWWKQEGSGELCSKDYVQEWIGSQISPSANADWDDDKNSERPDFVSKAMENEEPREWKRHRKMEEWWKDEQLDELETKKVKKKTKRRFKLSIFKRTRKQKARGHENGLDTTNEFSFKKQENGDVFSRELSSTTSMRGTLCYVAPEYGGCGYLMEKADIYSFGVLILVIVSGRRPLHVLASPMKLEKANLISWCRQLAQGGDLLELVDERLKGDYNKAQASLCLNLALACLQKMPELRPDIGDIVKILKGEMDLPVLPYEFSPSPPSKWAGKSRSIRKYKNTVD